MILRQLIGKCALLATFVVIALATGGIAWWVGRGEKVSTDGRSEEVGQVQTFEGSGFHERGPQSGIAFHMNFLPTEQKQNFKVNLYDHGCGVAVADYNGDGHDDIYFTNQLGANTLYRNNGDGTFTDVTRQAGVAVGDRVCVAAAFADYDNDGYQHPEEAK